MTLSPYRVAAERSEPQAGPQDDACPNGDMLPVLALLWIGSVARVWLGVARGERFAAEASLASLAVLLLPFATRTSLAWCALRVWRRLCARRK